MTTLNQQPQVNEQGLYQPAHQPLLGKDNLSQKFEFDSPNTLAKQSQFQQAGGQQQWAGQGLGQGLQSGSIQAPPLPQSRSRQPRRQINLRTRDWNNQPWNHQGQGQWGADTYRPPASLLGGGLQQQQASSSLPPLHPTGLPTSNYQPSSTIPLQHNYHLPHSQLATSSVTQQQDVPSARLNKNYLPGETLGNNSLNANNFGNNNLNTNNFGNSGLNNNISNNQFGNSNIGNNQFGGIPNAPAWTGFRRGYQRGYGQRKQMRPLRTRNWGNRTENGWSGFNPNNAVQEAFLLNRMRFAPEAPRMQSAFGRQRQWQRGPYRMRPLRTRHWGLRTENGWSHFSHGIYANESALPFMNRNRNLNWADESLNSGYGNGLNNGLNNYTNTSYLPQQHQGIAPVAALAPLVGNTNNRKQGKRASRRQARKQAKQAAIAQQLNTQLNPPVGDPAVNHYRRGAPAAVPITGAAPGGLAAASGGKLSSRRRGRRNNLGRRRGRTANNALPVPATQPPFVAPVAAAPLMSAPVATAPIGNSYPNATYRTVYHNSNIPTSNFVNQPSTAFRPIGTQHQGIYNNNLSTSNAGNFSRASSNGLYTSSELQQRPLSNTLGNSSGVHSNLPLYSAHEPVAAGILEKRAQAPVIAPARGNATF